MTDDASGRMTLAIWFVLAACAVAVATDVTTRRIPNWLTGLLAVAALAFHAMHGWRELAASIVALVVVMFLGFLAFSMGWLGGGDVELAAAVGRGLRVPRRRSVPDLHGDRRGRAGDRGRHGDGPLAQRPKLRHTLVTAACL